MNCHLRLRRHDWWPMLKAFDKHLDSMPEGAGKRIAAVLRAELFEPGFGPREVCVRCGRSRR